MANHIIGSRRNRILPIGSVRIATTLIGSKRNRIVSDDLILEVGAISIDCIAVGVGAFYRVAASGFNWISQDGLVTATNDEAFTGGELVASGGLGTTMSKVRSTTPMFCTGYRKDL